MQTDPIFIIGTERSGSNLLRLMLNAHSAVAVPHPPHIFKYFSPLLKRYGDLAEPLPMKRLIKDVLALIDTHIYPWEIRIDAEKLYREAAPRSLLGILAGIYGEYLRSFGKRRWGCKSTFMIHYAGVVLETYPNAKFIWLVRDPRAVAASSRLSVFSPFHPYYTAVLWRRQQLEGLDLFNSISKSNITLVRYEDLVKKPESAVTGICAFLGEEYEPGMLDFFKTGAARKSAALSGSWVNAASPVRTGSISGYRQSLSKSEGRLVEAVAGDLMDRFGYEREYSAGDRVRRRKEGPRLYAPSFPRICWYRVLDAAWFLRMECYSLLNDSNHWLRWRRSLLLARLVLARRFGRSDGAGRIY